MIDLNAWVNTPAERTGGNSSNNGDKKDFPLISSGIYHCKVDKAEYKIFDSGAECINLMMRIMEGEFLKRVFFHKLWLTPKAMGWSKATLEDVFNIEVTDPSVLSTTDFLETLLDTECIAEYTAKGLNSGGYEDFDSWLRPQQKPSTDPVAIDAPPF